MPFEVQGYTITHWNDHSSGKYETRGQRRINIYNICQHILKGANLLHKRGIVGSQIKDTVDGGNFKF